MPLNSNYFGELFIRALGVFMAALSWSQVIFRQRVRWKGRNRAPLSLPSKLVFAVATTAWCLAVFGVYPIYGAAVFAACMLSLWPLAARDRRIYDRVSGVGHIKPLPLAGKDLWKVFWFYDLLALAGSGVALVRDMFAPPATDEQRLLHSMAIGIFLIAALGAVALRVNPAPGDRDLAEQVSLKGSLVSRDGAGLGPVADGLDVFGTGDTERLSTAEFSEQDFG